ncbi:hypothetical protein [Gilliamella sp. Pas-s25]|uniref:hypothetical protein n=1 Tax=Gilliamella sp. Pas-s25 TaxID=2687310 RepID=UPI00135DC777|nr:hypothetical protein [Gilliamella sp. Pas-s25]MWP63114.1 hypothetical protein [Gilliamella sp. Pas-s25]
MKKFLKWVFIILFVIPACVGILKGIFGDKTISENTKTSKPKNYPKECEGFELTSKELLVIGDSFIYKKNGDSYEKIVNEKVSKGLGSKEYISVSGGTTVIEECIDGDYSWVRITEPDWLVNTGKIIYFR